MKKVFGIALLVCFWLILSGNVWSQTVMHPDEATLRKWIEDYENAPKFLPDAVIHERLLGAQQAGVGTSINLLDYLSYDAEERNQASCGDCWVWAGTGIMQVALAAQNGIEDKLSIQFFNSCKTDRFPCCGGNLKTFADWYSGTKMAVPWDNTNASFQDDETECQNNLSFVSCGNISTTPNYPITNITAVTIPTQGVGQSTAVNNIKSALHQKKAIWLSLGWANKDDFNAFLNFWLNSNESTLWNPDPYCGHKWNGGSFHAIVIVGYNDDDPDTRNHYWIVLNSWGTANGNRPHGLFRLPMYINYDCSFSSGSTTYHVPEIMTLDVAFNPPSPPTEKPNLRPYQPSGWSDKIVVSKATGTTTDSSSLLPTDALYVDWAVINDGSASISNTSYTQLYVDGVLTKTWSTDPPFGPGQFAYVSDYSIGSLSSGTHTIKIVADSTNAVSENDEGDNEYTKRFTVQSQSAQVPNLTPYQPKGWSDKIVVSNVTGTTTDANHLKTTDTLYVSWAVVNSGPIDISNEFYVSLYADGLFIHSWHCASLNTGAYVYVQNYAIGTLGAGSHTLTIFADSNQQITESNKTDNKYTKTITVEVTNPVSTLSNLRPYQPKNWSDVLVVSTVAGTQTDSNSITLKDDLYISWAVLNENAVATPGGFSVDLYIDGFFENSWSRSSPLKSNYYWSIKDYAIGNLYPGPHLFELLADSEYQISESDEDDNYYAKWINVGGPFFAVLYPNLKLYQPEGWLDKMVVYTPNRTLTDSPAFSTKDPLYIDWALINDAEAGTSKGFSVMLSVDGIPKKVWKIGILKANGHYTVKRYAIGKLSAGFHTFTLVVDPEGVIQEEDSNDKEYSKTIQVLAVSNP